MPCPLVCVSLALLGCLACKVPLEESGRTGPSVAETLGIEIDERGIEIRELRRKKRRLVREVKARRVDLREYEKAKLAATQNARQAKVKLDRILAELHFLEQSQSKATQRSTEIRAWLAQLAKDEKERIRLEKRKLELPKLLDKAKAALVAEERELASLNALLKKMEAERPKPPPAKAAKGGGKPAKAAGKK